MDGTYAHAQEFVPDLTYMTYDQGHGRVLGKAAARLQYMSPMSGGITAVCVSESPPDLPMNGPPTVPAKNR